ncbi:AEC family transporter [Portibacter lacus]
MKRKISSKEQLGGIKSIILSLALPATIFIALLKIDIAFNLLILPLLAFVINILLFGSGFALLKCLGIKYDSAKGRTILLLSASMAPGLSCFPFIIEYLGEQSLAYAAFADVGNKFFGLILLYLIAMHWFYKLTIRKGEKSTKEGGKIKGLLLALVNEPINIVLFVGLGMLIFGLNLNSLPIFIQSVAQRLSLIMTPLVLIFIGLAVNVNRKAVKLILQILFWKSGIAFIISGIILLFLPSNLSLASLILVVAFPQSAFSFWPYAHMTAVKSLEKKKGVKTFDSKLALNMLAFSLPFSTILILIICSSGPIFANSWLIIGLGVGFVLIPILFNLFTRKSGFNFSSVPRENLQLSK